MLCVKGSLQRNPYVVRVYLHRYTPRKDASNAITTVITSTTKPSSRVRSLLLHKVSNLLQNVCMLKNLNEEKASSLMSILF